MKHDELRFTQKKTTFSCLPYFLHILTTQESIPHQADERIYDSSWNLCRVQNKQLHSWRRAAPPFTHNLTPLQLTLQRPVDEIVSWTSRMNSAHLLKYSLKSATLWIQLLSPSCQWFESFSCFLSANIRSQDVHLSATRVGPCFR